MGCYPAVVVAGAAVVVGAAAGAGAVAVVGGVARRVRPGLPAQRLVGQLAAVQTLHQLVVAVVGAVAVGQAAIQLPYQGHNLRPHNKFLLRGLVGHKTSGHRLAREARGTGATSITHSSVVVPQHRPKQRRLRRRRSHRRHSRLQRRLRL